MNEEERKDLLQKLAEIKKSTPPEYDYFVFQPWKPTPNNPAPILRGSAETIKFIAMLLKKIEEQQKEIRKLKKKVSEE